VRGISSFCLLEDAFRSLSSIAYSLLALLSHSRTADLSFTMSVKGPQWLLQPFILWHSVVMLQSDGCSFQLRATGCQKSRLDESDFVRNHKCVVCVCA